MLKSLSFLTRLEPDNQVSQQIKINITNNYMMIQAHISGVKEWGF